MICSKMYRIQDADGFENWSALRTFQMADRRMQNNVVNFPGKKLPSAEDDYRHRMRSNLAALAFISLLLLLSCWVIDALLSIPSRTDCNFSVRRPCHVNFSASNASLGRGGF